jgi:ATP-dependent DNA helicase DinG
MSQEFDFECFFPYPSVRKEQADAISFALNAFLNEGKRFVVIEAGTGTGKSGIGLAISRYLAAHGGELGDDTSEGSWFLTTQKILQDQYVQDFGPPAGWMETIKSSSNYQCKFKKMSCAESRQLLKAESSDSPFKKACGTGHCTYVKARTAFVESRESITNFPYFMTYGNLGGGVSRRRLLVVDEAHNIEGELSKFIDVTISEHFAKRVLKINMPHLRTQYQAIRWIREEYFPRIEKHVKHIRGVLEKYKGLQNKIKQFVSLAKQIELLEGHFAKIETFLSVYDKDNWVMNSIKSDGKKGRKLEFKVIDVSPFSESNLFRFGDKVLMMSATILDGKAYCQSLGIDESEAAFIQIPTPFPVENRPVFFTPVGKMSRANIDRSLPKMIEMIKTLMDHHKDEKGIIHTHTFKIAHYIKNNIRDSRLLIHDSSNREEILEKHKKSKKPTILLSPSMTEGVDLKGDYSRFQVICKIPYPYLGDSLTKKRMNRWNWWYGLQTSKTIVQSVGRSVRSMEDYAVTYILDSDWERFFDRNSNVFPASFKKAMQ